MEWGSRRKPARSRTLSCRPTDGSTASGAIGPVAGLQMVGADDAEVSPKDETSEALLVVWSSSRWYVAISSAVRSRRSLDGVSAYVNAIGCSVTGLST